MTKGVPKKRQRDEPLRKKRLQAAPTRGQRRPRCLLKRTLGVAKAVCGPRCGTVRAR
jgi:hypothetical protein